MITPLLPDAAPCPTAGDDASASDSPEALEAAGSAFAALLATTTTAATAAPGREPETTPSAPTDPSGRFALAEAVGATGQPADAATDAVAATAPAPPGREPETTPSAPTDLSGRFALAEAVRAHGGPGGGAGEAPGGDDVGEEPGTAIDAAGRPSAGAGVTGRGISAAVHARHADPDGPRRVDDIARRHHGPVERADEPPAPTRDAVAPGAGVGAAKTFDGVQHLPAPLPHPHRADAATAAAGVRSAAHVPETPLADQLGAALSGAELRHLPEGEHELRVDLHPAELGAVGVDVTVHHDKLHVVLRPEHAAAAELLGQSLPDLRKQLHDAGLGLADLRLGERREALADQRPDRSDPERSDRGRSRRGAEAAAVGALGRTRHRPHASTSAVDLML